MRRTSLRLALAATTALASFALASPASAQATLPQVSPGGSGGATITRNTSTGVMTVDINGANRVIRYDSFVLGTPSSSSETLTFLNSGAAGNYQVLNRVVAGSGSQIYGSISSPSSIQIWLIDPAGILFGPTGSFSGGGLVLSTAQLTGADEANFLTGTLNTLSNATTAPIIFQSGSGTITASGAIVAVAQSITANKTMSSSGNSVALVAAQDVTFSNINSPLSFTISQGTTLASGITIGGAISGQSIRVAGGVDAAITSAILNVNSGATLTATASGGSIILATRSTSGIAISNASGGAPGIASSGVAQASGATADVRLWSAGSATTGSITAGRDVYVLANSLTADLSVNGDIQAGQTASLTSDRDILGSGSISAGSAGIVANRNLNLTGALDIVGNLSVFGSVVLLGSVEALGDVSIVAQGGTLQVNGSISGRDVAVQGLGSVTLTGGVTAQDDIVLRAGGALATGALTSGTGADVAGVGDSFAGATLAGGDVDIAGNGAVLFTGQVRATGAAADIRISPGAAGIGDANQDLDLVAGGDIILNFGDARGRDVALDAGGSVRTGAITARDDIAIRANGSVTTGSLTSGTTVSGMGAIDAAGAADTLSPDGSLEGADVRIWGNGVTVGAVRANGAGAGIKIDGGAGGIGNGAQDLDLQAGAAIVLTGDARGRDVALTAGAPIITGSISARDDIAIQGASSVTTGALTAGTTVDTLPQQDLAGAGDLLSPDGTLEGADVRIWGNGVTVGAVRANGAGAGIKIDGGARGIGSAAQDLDLHAGASIVLTGPARGRDIALDAGLSVITGTLEARDDIVIRLPNSGGTAIAGRSAGVTVDGQPPEDSIGAADALAGETLTGNRNEVRRDP